MKIETERLIIRSFEKNDLPDFKKLLNIQEVTGWTMQKNRAEEFLDWHIEKYINMDIVSSVVCFGIFDKETKQILGSVGVGEHDDLHETELFYNLLSEARGKGYATEAAKAVTDWVFENYEIPYIIGTTVIDNIKSQLVLERIGYQFFENKTLLVHIENKLYDFKYYRYYCSNAAL